MADDEELISIIKRSELSCWSAEGLYGCCENCLCRIKRGNKNIHRNYSGGMKIRFTKQFFVKYGTSYFLL